MAIVVENIGDNYSGTNSGFVTELILIDEKDIISILDPIYQADPLKPFTVINGNVRMKIDVKAYKIKFRTKSCSFNESVSIGTHGIQYNTTFSFDVPRNNIILASWFHKNRSKRWITVWCDANGQCYITGEPDFGVQILNNRKIGSGTNTTGVSLNCISWHQSWSIQTIDLELLSQTTFNEDFTEEFSVGY